MGTPYTGDPTVSPHAPDTGPIPAGAPQIQLPADGDPPNASTWAQAYKVLADWVAFGRAPFANVSDWARSLIYYRTAKKHSRFGIDHMGLPAGRIIDWREWWPVDASVILSGPDIHDYAPLSASLPGWAGKIGLGSSAGAGAIGFFPAALEAGTSGPRSIGLFVGDTDGDYTYVQREAAVCFSADSHVAFEFEAKLTDPAAANVSYLIGLATDIGGAGHEALTGGAYFFKGAGTANWFGVTKANGVGAGDNCGPAASGYHRFRIEWHGGNVSDDAAARVLFFIDGVLLGNRTANLPSTDSVVVAQPLFGATNSGGGAAGFPKRINVGPVHFTSNLYAVDAPL